MAGYYNEETGEWVDLGDDSPGYSPLDDTSGTNTMHDAAIWDPGSQSYTDWQGYPVDASGQPLPGNPSYISDVGSPAADSVDPVSGISSFFTKMFGGNFTAADLKNLVQNNAGALTGLAGLYTAMQGNKGTTAGTGYQGTVPSLAGIRSAIHYNDLNRAPGSAGRQYFTDMAYVAPGLASAAQTAANTRANQIAAETPVAAAKPNPYTGTFATPWANRAPQAQGTQKMATGGLAHGRYLQGNTDGMADEINTSIDDKQPAKLSHGEFVVPADVVSHLGNGNSDAGAQRLYSMMDKVREARTGTKKQGKEIDPDKFMPGGLASSKKYAGGGAVAFDTGGDVKGFSGTTGSLVPATGTSTSSSLSPWAGDYVTNMLGQGAAAAQAPYQAYTGQLTAGPSDLQQQQFAGLSQVAQTGLTPTQFTNQFTAPAAYNPTTFTAGAFDTTQANKYMNPYLQASLDPQLAELRRQAQIANVADASKLTSQGGFGGGRQAVLMGEQNRNLLDKSQQLIGQGYNTAYTNAMNQFNADQARSLEAQKATEASRQFGAGQGLSAAQYGAQYGQAANAAQEAANQASAQFGLNSLAALGAAGATQRDIEQQGLTADKTQFEEQRDYPLKMAQYQQGLLTNLPISTATNTANNTTIGQLQNTVGGLTGLYQLLANLGQTPTTK